MPFLNLKLEFEIVKDSEVNEYVCSINKVSAEYDQIEMTRFMRWAKNHRLVCYPDYFKIHFIIPSLEILTDLQLTFAPTLSDIFDSPGMVRAVKHALGVN